MTPTNDDSAADLTRLQADEQRTREQCFNLLRALTELYERVNEHARILVSDPARQSELTARTKVLVVQIEELEGRLRYSTGAHSKALLRLQKALTYDTVAEQ